MVTNSKIKLHSFKNPHYCHNDDYTYIRLVVNVFICTHTID